MVGCATRGLEGKDIHLKNIITLAAALSEDGKERQKLCLPSSISPDAWVPIVLFFYFIIV
jgi:hypothetical protein